MNGPPINTDNGDQTAFAARRALADANCAVTPVRKRDLGTVLGELERERTGFLGSHFDVTAADGQTYRVIVVRVAS